MVVLDPPLLWLAKKTLSNKEVQFMCSNKYSQCRKQELFWPKDLRAKSILSIALKTQLDPFYGSWYIKNRKKKSNLLGKEKSFIQ